MFLKQASASRGAEPHLGFPCGNWNLSYTSIERLKSQSGIGSCSGPQVWSDFWYLGRAVAAPVIRSAATRCVETQGRLRQTTEKGAQLTLRPLETSAKEGW